MANIAKLLEELVCFVGEETALSAKVKQAVEWVISKPEGEAMLRAAKELHGGACTLSPIPALLFINADLVCMREHLSFSLILMLLRLHTRWENVAKYFLSA